MQSKRPYLLTHLFIYVSDDIKLNVTKQPGGNLVHLVGGRTVIPSNVFHSEIVLSRLIPAFMPFSSMQISMWQHRVHITRQSISFWLVKTEK